MANDIYLKIHAAVDDAVRELSRVNQSIGQLGDLGEKTGRALKLPFTELKSAIGLVGLGLDVLKQGWDFAKEGAQIELVRTRFDRLAASIGTTGDALERDLRAATRGMLSESELLSSAVDLMSLGLAKTHDEAVRLARVSSALNMPMNQLVLTLTNMTTMRFDALNVSVDGFERRLKELEKTGLSTEAAFRRAFLEQAEAQIARVGDAGDTAAGKMQRFENRIKDIGDRLKLFAAEALLPILEEGELINTIYDSQSTAAQRLAAATQYLEAGYGTWRLIIEDVYEDLYKEAEAEKALIMLDSEAALRKNMLAASMRQTVSAGDDLLAYIAAEEAGMKASAAHTDAWRQSVDVLAASQKALTTELLFQQASKGLDTEAALKLGQAMGVVNSSTVDVLRQLQNAKSVYDANRDGLINATEAARGYYSAVLDLNRSLADLPESKEIHVSVVMDTEGMTALGGGRATGGPVYAGGVYTVGERGPETLIMNRGGGGGFVVPHASTTTNYHANFNISGGNPAAIADYIDRRLGRHADYRRRTA